MQIRTRLTIQFLLIVASILLVAMFYIHFQFKTHLQNEFYDNLRSKALMTVQMVTGKHGVELRSQKAAHSLLSSSYTENVSIYSYENSERLYSFNPSPDEVQPSILKNIRSSKEVKFSIGKFIAIGLVYTNLEGQPYIVIAEAVFNSEQLLKLRNILVWVFFLSTALVALGGWFFAGQALSPLSKIMNQVDEILPNHLHPSKLPLSQRLEAANNHDELARLVFTFNKLLDRIQHAFNNQKLFLSNISHELKNPLTVIISQLEVTLQKERHNAEYQQTLQSVLDDMKGLDQVASKLMQLARVNADGDAPAFQPLRLDEVIWQSKETLLKSNPDYKIGFEVVNLPEKEEMLLVNGNEQLLKTALINLMDNGCKFSPNKKAGVRLSFSPEGKITVEIHDNGPGIRPDEQKMIFEPFYRSPATASIKGTGIGLSLVDSIAKLHQIKLKITPNHQSGTVFKLEFPLAPTNR